MKGGGQHAAQKRRDGGRYRPTEPGNSVPSWEAASAFRLERKGKRQRNLPQHRTLSGPRGGTRGSVTLHVPSCHRLEPRGPGRPDKADGPACLGAEGRPDGQLGCFHWVSACPPLPPGQLKQRHLGSLSRRPETVGAASERSPGGGAGHRRQEATRVPLKHHKRVSVHPKGRESPGAQRSP